MVTRRRALYILGAAAAAALLGLGLLARPQGPGAAEERATGRGTTASTSPTTAATTRPAGGRLAVYNYSYYIDKDLIPEFEREYGVEVIYEEFEAGEDAYGALLAGGRGYDLVVVPDSYLKDAISKGLVRRLDHGKLSNLGNLDGRFFENPNDPGLQYSVPYAFGTTGIAANLYAMREAGVDVKIEAWSDLFDVGKLARLRGRVAMLEEFTEPVMAAKYALGIDPDDWSEGAVSKVVEALRMQRDYLLGYLGISAIVPRLVAGRELWISQIWSGDALTVQQQFAQEAKQDPSMLPYILPRPQTHMWVDFMVIPRDARNVEAAYLFMDFLLRPQNAARITKASNYPTAVKRQLVAPHLDRELLENPAVYPPEGARLIQLNYTQEMLDAVDRIRMAVRS